MAKKKYRQTPEEFWAIQDKRYEKAISRYTSSCISNAKWARVFAVLSKHQELIEKIVWQFVYGNGGQSFGKLLPDADDAAMGDWEFFPLRLREVESVEFFTLNPDELEQLLNTDGKYALERTESGIRLFAYLQ